MCRYSMCPFKRGIESISFIILNRQFIVTKTHPVKNVASNVHKRPPFRSTEFDMMSNIYAQEVLNFDFNISMDLHNSISDIRIQKQWFQKEK